MRSDKTSSPSERFTPLQARAFVEEEQAVLLDVRCFDEFAAVHAVGAISLPLPDLERRASELPDDRPIVCICASGHRSQNAVARLRTLGWNNVTDILGGTNAWEADGLPVQKQRRAIPLERQVRGVAGSLVLGFGLLGFTVSPTFFWGATFIGFMLTLTALLGICPMMSILKLLPWNRSAATTTTE